MTIKQKKEKEMRVKLFVNIIYINKFKKCKCSFVSNRKSSKAFHRLFLWNMSHLRRVLGVKGENPDIEVGGVSQGINLTPDAVYRAYADGQNNENT